MIVLFTLDIVVIAIIVKTIIVIPLLLVSLSSHFRIYIQCFLIKAGGHFVHGHT